MNSNPENAVCFNRVQLVHVAERAGARTTRIAAGSARTGWPGGGRRALGGDGEDRELWLEFPGVALRALGCFLAVDKSFELMMAFLADVFVDGHGHSVCLA